ncbi:MAG: hypothetical protein KKH98_01080 [Spirochaetes bacterium]|nr:hypothetical protein [Spirochaetota bacterium]
MKIFSLIFIFCTLFSEGLYASDKEDKIISLIRDNYVQINSNIGKFRLVTKEFSGESTEGGSAEIYYKDKTAVKIVITYYGEMGKSIEEYYFSEEKLIFVFVRDYQYNRPIYFDAQYASENNDEAFDIEKSKVLESRYYFHNEGLIRWIDEDKKKMNKKTEKFIQKEKSIKEEMKRIREMIK